MERIFDVPMAADSLGKSFYIQVQQTDVITGIQCFSSLLDAVANSHANGTTTLPWRLRKSIGKRLLIVGQGVYAAVSFYDFLVTMSI